MSAFKKYQIIRHENLDVDKFRENFYEKKHPALISKSLNWSALDLWNEKYLTNKYPDKQVSLTKFSRKITNDVLGAKLNMSFPEALKLIQNNSDKDCKYYLMQQSMETDFSEIMSDLSEPKYICDKVENINFWLGEAGVNTRPHYDIYNGFLAQIKGRKIFRLFNPVYTDNMYPHDIADSSLNNYPSVHVSRVADTEIVDFNEYSNLRKVECFEGILYPGDLLYIPAGWWHEVKSLDTSISINFWSKATPFSLTAPQLTDIICSYFNWFGVDSFGKYMHRNFDLSNFKDDLEIAKAALLGGLLKVCAIFLIIYLASDKMTRTNNLSRKQIKKMMNYLENANLKDSNMLNETRLQEIIDQIELTK